MTTISLLNAKGGVSKSLSAAALAYLLSCLRKRVLIIDLDPQGNISSIYSISSLNAVSDMLADEKSELGSYIQSSKYNGIDVVAGDESLTEVIYQLYDQEKETEITFRLRDKIRKIENQYDYVIIDNSPFSSYLTKLSLAASDIVLAPIDVDNFSYEGLLILFRKIKELNRTTDADISFKVFFTKVNSRTNLFKSLKEQYEEALGKIFCETYIRADNNARESATLYRPLPEYAPKCKATEDYIRLSKEVLGLSAKDISKIEKELYSKTRRG